MIVLRTPKVPEARRAKLISAAGPDGAVAAVRLTSIATGQIRTTSTDESGRYTFSLLPVASYQLAVEHPSFRRYERSGILLQANDNVKIDFRMVGADTAKLQYCCHSPALCFARPAIPPPSSGR